MPVKKERSDGAPAAINPGEGASAAVPEGTGTGRSLETAQAVHELRASGELLRVTLSSIGDAVVATDVKGRVTYLNPVREDVTGWSQPDAAGVPLERVFRIINEATRAVVESPTVRALRAR